MKIPKILLFFLFPLLFLSAEEKLVVYCYNSFSSDWGAGPVIVEKFEKQTGIKVELKTPGDAVVILSSLIAEKKKPKADVVVGLDNNMMPRVHAENILSSYTPKEIKNIDESLLFDSTNQLIPFDYGYFSICYNTEQVKNPPHSLEELLDPELKKSIVLLDPRTSSPGLGFLYWTIAVYGDDYLDYWKKLKPNLLTVSDSWSSGYGIFLNGEAPYALSYSTSPIYHVEFEDTTQYQALIFDKGNYRQIEAMGIVKGTKNRKAAELFIDFMLNTESQKTLAISNAMFPVNQKTPLPKSYDYALKPDKAIELPAETIAANREKWISDWVNLFY